MAVSRYLYYWYRMRFLLAYPIFIVLIASCKVNRHSSFYSGDYHQDSIIRSIDNKYMNQERIKITKGKRHFGKDSIVYYAINKATNQLHAVGFTELKTNSRTSYELINGELIKVGYILNNNDRSASAVYFYNAGNCVLKREKNIVSMDPNKFLQDVQFFKRALHVE